MTVEELYLRLQRFDKNAEVLIVDGTLGEWNVKDLTQNEKGTKVTIWFGKHIT